MKIYGIPNCDTVKKARTWLTEHAIAYEFHDFKKQGVSAAQLEGWTSQVGWEALLNKKGTTWRKLDPVQQSVITDASAAIALMQEYPSLIKRPVLDKDGRIFLGFNPADYETIFR